MRVSLLGALMGFGLYRLFFGHTLYSAAALLAPFIVVAAGACHSVQFLSRFFFEEYPRLGDVRSAIVSTFVSRLRPMLVSLLCDVVPFAIMAVIPFENVRSLGIVTGLGLASLTFDEFVMMIPALSSITMKELENEHFHAAKNTGASSTDIWLEELLRSIIDRPAVGIGILVVTVHQLPSWGAISQRLPLVRTIPTQSTTISRAPGTAIPFSYGAGDCSPIRRCLSDDHLDRG